MVSDADTYRSQMSCLVLDFTDVFYVVWLIFNFNRTLASRPLYCSHCSFLSFVLLVLTSPLIFYIYILGGLFVVLYMDILIFMIQFLFYVFSFILIITFSLFFLSLFYLSCNNSNRVCSL